MNPAPRRALVTGAAGFIGSHLARRLLDAGWTVAALVRAGTDRRRLAPIADRLEWLEADLADRAAVERALAGFRPETVLHLATYYAVAHRPEELPLMLDTNLKGTIHLLEAAGVSGVRRFVNAGTCFVYAPSDRPLAESAPLAPFNFYALTKLWAESALDYYASRAEFDAVTLRLFPPYGPGDHARRLIPSVARQLAAGEAPDLTRGEQRWDFTYVADQAEAFLLAAGAAKLDSPHARVNIGTGAAVSVRQVVERLRELTGAAVEPNWGAVPERPGELRLLQADAGKARRLLGWSARVDILQTGLEQTLAAPAAPAKGD